MYIFCMCIFYTFIRPIELRRLKVWQVDLENQKIYIDGTQSKNKKSEYVVIPEPLKKIFMETRLLERDKDIMQCYGYGKNKAFELIKKCKKAFDITHKEAFVPIDVWIDFLHCRFPKSNENQVEIKKKSA
ncbi:MAG: hypothetical protein NZ516_07170 [Raineya sp.]|nr:hypothetical protein [Raineya sp.]